MSDNNKAPACGAELVVRNLEAHGVRWVFGIPGAKVDRVFDSLEDSSIQTIVARHEANAAFMAGAVGRLTGKAGVALVTSGPGCSNLPTGLATATSEGDPMLALGGVVPLAERLKQVHQTLDTVSLFKPVTKYSAEITAASAVSETIANALRAAESGRPGGAFVALPNDLMNAPAQGRVLAGGRTPQNGVAPPDAVREAAELINSARQPVLLLGLQASQEANSNALRKLLAQCPLPVVGTFQAAGAVDQPNFELFAGRIGLWSNQAGDALLKKADLVVTIGYGPVEYEPPKWNADASRKIIHLDVIEAEIDNCYNPDVELLGDIALNLEALAGQLKPKVLTPEAAQVLSTLAEDRKHLATHAPQLGGSPLHPLKIVSELQALAGPDVTMCVDMGSFHIWIARYLNSFRARQLLITNGQQTMGVALPWAIAASLVRPTDKIISVSGDGSFMQSSMELETAVRLGCNIMHVIWIDNCYNMVMIQEDKKYGRPSGVQFGPIDFKAYADAMGAKGFAVHAADQLRATLRAAMDHHGPSVVAIPVDYADNPKLMADLRMGQMV
ncbi:acetolactate synthase AlsS [Frateuria aurantia]|uniref:Acetolactate synthase, catabolic n=1 Tax=Frateuria aurantia (strain ATCC 33424 / DSM 6220 / KCTC 2777 / LMG 1558 / NBRC 3245 / NCIMB 13370) TaxID=767434 RepID=H8KYH7_FRAAD|nr:acetolactate synthase AlsS [Frateuria aurantia]AFC86983.1 acetolactate synthase, catabolic [Frateuria aurantia DSM 6220]